MSDIRQLVQVITWRPDFNFNFDLDDFQSTLEAIIHLLQQQIIVHCCLEVERENNFSNEKNQLSLILVSAAKANSDRKQYDYDWPAP